MKDATAKLTAGRTGLIQWSVLAAFALVLAIVVVQSRIQPESRVADAQGLPPNAGWIIFDGQVTVNGRTPDVTGFELVARVGDWESRPVVVGRLPQNPHNFYHLIVNPPHEGHKGQQIEFWVADEKSTSTDYYAVITELTGEVCFGCPFTFPIRRSITLDFARIPASAVSGSLMSTDTPTVEPSPTPTPRPTATPGLPANTGWIIFDGEVTVNGQTPDVTGFQVVARIGEWESAPVTVGLLPLNPRQFYHLTVNPPHEGHRGEQIEFWIADERSDTTDYYAVITEQTGEACFDCPFTFPIRRSVTLDFARIPAPAPAATPSPVPTATDQTSNTPTVTPVPTEPPDSTATLEPTRSPLSVAQLLATFTRFILSTCTTIEGMAGFDWLQSECDAIVETLR